VVRALEAADLKVEWDGDTNHYIEVQLESHRRRAARSQSATA